MDARLAVVLLFLTAPFFGQTSQPACPADRPVDEIIREVNKQYPKRNKNPLPEVVCVWGWCRETGSTPPTIPPPAPTTPPGAAPAVSDGTSTSKVSTEKCGDAMEMSLAAAHDTDAGDYDFKIRNYQGALLRYQAALDEKPGDVAIYVRLGRVYEKLHRVPQALEQYRAAEKLAGPKNYTDEAEAALRRLEGRP